MLKRGLAVLILALSQVSCYVSEERGGYKPADLSVEERQGWERLKRDFLQIESIESGDGPLAAWGRKISADIETKYADGTLIYRGPVIVYFGMRDSVFIHNGVAEDGMLAFNQTGIALGLNGMAVGGKRKITVQPKLTCERLGEEGADPNVSCTLIRYNRKIERPIDVRKEMLIVEATLTASCIPVFMEIPFIYNGQFRCRNSDIPKLDSSAPIWHVY